jgi:hypothetical protein
MSTVATIETLFATLLAGDASIIPVLEDAILEGVEDAPKGTTFACIERKGYKRGTHVEPSKRVVGRFAVVSKGKIRIVGLAYPVRGNVHGDQSPYDRTFEIGDTVEYDSFNLSYHGKITSIGAGGNVTVAHPWGKRSTRLDAERFTSRNWDLDLVAAGQRNQEISMSL